MWKRSWILAVGLVAAPAMAHVPFIEDADYKRRDPFRDPGSIEQSRAIYAWLETGADVDFYLFPVEQGEEVFAEVIVPVCPEYADFLPGFVAIGPGLPPPAEPLPFPLPPGFGAIIVRNVPPGAPREQFFEPIGGKSYYDGPDLELIAPESGPWAFIVWDPFNQGGDYVMSVGRTEFFDAGDILQSLALTPIIRRDGELHTSCD